MTVVGRLLLGAVLLLAPACKARDKAPPASGGAAAAGSAGSAGSAAMLAELITRAERARGEAACRDFATQACACAKAHPGEAAVGQSCMLASAMPDALTMSLEIGGHPESSRPTAKQLQQNARDVIAKCFAGLAALPPMCAAPAAGSAAGGSAAP